MKSVSTGDSDGPPADDHEVIARHPAPPLPGPFSAELKELAAQFDHRSSRLGDLLAATHTRGYHLLLFVIALPFVGPIPLPGFSIPFGAAIALIGARMAVDRPPWLPSWLMRRRLPPHVLAHTLQGASKIVMTLERFTRPRLARLTHAHLCQRLAGALIVISGLFMTLPLPLPFSNSLPAWTVIFLAGGALAGDGLFLLVGLLSFLVSVAFFVFVFLGGERLLTELLAIHA